MKSLVTKQTLKMVAITIFLCILSAGIAHSESAGPAPGNTGAPAPAERELPPEPTCGAMSGTGVAGTTLNCHGSMPAVADPVGKIELFNLPDNYVPGRQYRFFITVTHPMTGVAAPRYGFQTTALVEGTFAPGGQFPNTNGRPTGQATTLFKMGGPGDDRQYISHGPVSFSAQGSGERRGRRWTIDWIAPADNPGDVNFYAVGNVANGNSLETLDRIYTNSPNPLRVTKGQYSFTDVAAAANVAAGAGRGVAVGDYNKDGRADIFVAADGHYLLYRNNEDGTFTEVDEAAGLTAGDAQGRAAAWADYNGDGNLDLYVVNASPDRLYRNNGDGTFTDVSAEAGISSDAVGHAVAFTDLTGDGHPDLYVANEGQDDLYINNGDGTFSKADPAAAGIAESANSWSVAVADYNGDGRPDIFVANDGSAAVYRNDGGGMFTNVAAAAGIAALTADAQSRAVALADYDKDGDQDLFIGNVGQDLLFRNNGDGTFADVTMAVGLVENPVAAAAGAAWGDYDNDGDPDLIVVNEGQDRLYRNTTTVTLSGTGNNPAGTISTTISFTEVATFSGLTETAAGQAVAWVDVDNDQDLDLFVANADGGALYQNPGRSGPASASSARLTRPTSRRPGGYLIAVVVWLMKAGVI